LDIRIEKLDFGTRVSHRKGITVPVARQRKARTPWSARAEKVQIEARRAMRGGLPFMVWDGEGVTHTTGEFADGTMSYVLLGHTAGIDDTGPIYITDDRLHTLDLLDFIWETGKEYPNYFHVSFGFNFDVDQILRDIPDDLLQLLKDENTIKWRGYKIFWISRKIFSLTRYNRKITIYDTLSFFQTNLIKTAHKYVAGHPLIEIVEKGKAGRSSFNYDELDSIIIPYWIREGELMVSIMNALRHSMIGAGIHLEKWHGPGAIAESLIERERLTAHIQESRTEMPNEVVEATAYAFYGGRFEAMIIGDIPGPIYSYDIRSAYPNALVELGGLSGGEWKHYEFGRIYENGIYHIKNNGHPKQSEIGMGPLPWRNAHGLVSFPFICEGWYYGPEVLAAINTGWEIEILDGWQYMNGDPSPFLFLKDMYLQRAEYKREGNPAELACKLGFNSVWGKLTQVVGWDKRNFLPPKFHHHWYAGMTTSRARAKLWYAMSANTRAIIACETDGIYSRVPLDLRIGDQLGEWEYDEYDRMLYVQSGIYFGRQNGEWRKARTRGISKGNFTVDDALAALPTLRGLHSVSTRYGSLTGNLGSAKRFTWYQQESEAHWGKSEKRLHMPHVCDRCNWGDEWPGTEIHSTTLVNAVEGMGFPRPIPWIDGIEFVTDEDEDEDYL
jgi:hypothetical protein